MPQKSPRTNFLNIVWGFAILVAVLMVLVPGSRRVFRGMFLLSLRFIIPIAIVMIIWAVIRGLTGKSTGDRSPDPKAPPKNVTPPSCPSCHVPMTLRSAGKGDSDFWGCLSCNRTRKISE